MSFCPNAYYDELDNLRDEVCNLGDSLEGPRGAKGDTGRTLPIITDGIPTDIGQQGEMRISKTDPKAFLYIFDQGKWHTIEFGPDEVTTFTVAWATAANPTIQLSNFNPALDADTVIQVKQGGNALSVTVAKNAGDNTAAVTGNFGNAENVTVVVNGSEKPLAAPSFEVRATASENGEALTFSRPISDFAGHNETAGGVAYTIKAAGAISPPLLQGATLTIPATGATDAATGFGLAALGIPFTFVNQSTYTLPSVTLAAVYDGTNITVTSTNTFSDMDTAVYVDAVKSIEKTTYNNTITLTTNATFSIQLRDTEIVLDNGHTVAVDGATDVVNNATKFGVDVITDDENTLSISIVFQQSVSAALLAHFQMQHNEINNNNWTNFTNDNGWKANTAAQIITMVHNAKTLTFTLDTWLEGTFNFRFSGYNTTYLPNVPDAFTHTVLGANIVDKVQKLDLITIDNATVDTDGMEITVTTNHPIDHTNAAYGSPSIRVNGLTVDTTQQTSNYKTFTLTGFPRILKDQNILIVPSDKWPPVATYETADTIYTIVSNEDPATFNFAATNNSAAEIPTVNGHAVVRSTNPKIIDLGFSVVVSGGPCQLKTGENVENLVVTTTNGTNLALTAATDIVFAPMPMRISGLTTLKTVYELSPAIDEIDLHFNPVLKRAFWKDETTIKMTFNSPITDVGNVNVKDKDATILVTILLTNIAVTVAGGLYYFNGVAVNTRSFVLVSGNTYTFTGIPTAHPLALIGNGFNHISGTVFNQKNGNVYYTGATTVEVTGTTGILSLDCWFHGAMGGSDALVLTSLTSTTLDIPVPAFDLDKASYKLTNVNSMQNSIQLPVTTAEQIIENLTLTQLSITAASVSANGNQITATLSDNATATGGLQVFVDNNEFAATPILNDKTLSISLAEGLVVLQGQVVQLRNLATFLTPRAANEGEKMVNINDTFTVENNSIASIPQVVDAIMVSGANVIVNFDVALKEVANFNELVLVNEVNITQYTFPTHALSNASKTLTLTSETPIVWNENMFLKNMQLLQSTLNVFHDVDKLPVNFTPTPTQAFILFSSFIHITFNSPVTAPSNPGDILVFNDEAQAAVVNTVLVAANVVTLQTSGAWDSNIIYTVKGLSNISNIIGISSTLDEILTVDSTAPVITLNGANPLTWELGVAFIDPGASTDDGSTIIKTGNVDSNLLGNYTIFYNATDASNNVAVQKTRTVNVVDTTKPTINLKVGFENTVEKGGTFTPAQQSDVTVTDLTPPITVNVTGTVDVNIVGDYTITYTATDGEGNKATLLRVIQVQDTTAPVITLKNVFQNNTVEKGGTFTAASPDDVTVTDGTVTVDGTVDVNIVGDYTITYTATDASNNVSTLDRTVTVQDTTAPSLTLLGLNPLVLLKGATYTEPGFQASDGGVAILQTSTEGENNGVFISSTVNVTVVGNYTVTYTARDSAGNQTVKTRAVEITEPVVNAPTLVTATVTDATMTLTFDQSLNATAPANNAFTTIYPVTTVAVVDTLVTLTMDTTVSAEDTKITVAYSKAVGNLINADETLEVKSFVSLVTNNTVEPGAPTVAASIAADGQTLTLHLPVRMKSTKGVITNLFNDVTASTNDPNQLVSVSNAAWRGTTGSVDAFTKNVLRQSLVDDHARTGYKVGDRVSAVWPADAERYDATVFEVNANDLTVHWDDGSGGYQTGHPFTDIVVPNPNQEVTISNAAYYEDKGYAQAIFTKNVLRQSLEDDFARTGYKVGDRVNAMWSNGTRYGATVFAVNQDDLTVHWNDGSGTQQTHAFTGDNKPEISVAFTIPAAQNFRMPTITTAFEIPAATTTNDTSRLTLQYADDRNMQFLYGYNAQGGPTQLVSKTRRSMLADRRRTGFVRGDRVLALREGGRLSATVTLVGETSLTVKFDDTQEASTGHPFTGTDAPTFNTDFNYTHTAEVKVVNGVCYIPPATTFTDVALNTASVQSLYNPVAKKMVLKLATIAEISDDVQLLHTNNLLGQNDDLPVAQAGVNVMNDSLVYTAQKTFGVYNAYLVSTRSMDHATDDGVTVKFLATRIICIDVTDTFLSDNFTIGTPAYTKRYTLDSMKSRFTVTVGSTTLTNDDILQIHVFNWPYYMNLPYSNKKGMIQVELKDSVQIADDASVRVAYDGSSGDFQRHDSVAGSRKYLAAFSGVKVFNRLAEHTNIVYSPSPVEGDASAPTILKAVLLMSGTNFAWRIVLQTNHFLDTNHVPPASAFSISTTNHVVGKLVDSTNNIASVSIPSTANSQVHLDLRGGYDQNENISITYTPPDTNFLRRQFGASEPLPLQSIAVFKRYPKTIVSSLSEDWRTLTTYVEAQGNAKFEYSFTDAIDAAGSTLAPDADNRIIIKFIYDVANKSEFSNHLTIGTTVVWKDNRIAASEFGVGIVADVQANVAWATTNQLLTVEVLSGEFKAGAGEFMWEPLPIYHQFATGTGSDDINCTLLDNSNKSVDADWQTQALTFINYEGQLHEAWKFTYTFDTAFAESAVITNAMSRDWCVFRLSNPSTYTSCAWMTQLTGENGNTANIVGPVRASTNGFDITNSRSYLLVIPDEGAAFAVGESISTDTFTASIGNVESYTGEKHVGYASWFGGKREFVGLTDTNGNGYFETVDLQNSDAYTTIGDGSIKTWYSRVLYRSHPVEYSSQMNAFESQFKMDQHIAFSPNQVALTGYQAQTVHVKLNEPIITPDNQNDLKINLTSSTPNVVVYPAVLSWSGAEWQEVKTFTVQVVAALPTTLNDVVTTTVVTTSELYNNFNPIFEVTCNV